MGKKNKGKKAKPLTGLAAALVKSGHLSEKKAKTIAREQRREDKKLTRKERDQRDADREAALAAERAEQAAADRAREEARVAAQADDRATRAVKDGLLRGASGGRRWFFVARDGRVLYLDVSDGAARQLASGQAGIVETAGAASAEHAVVDARAVSTLTTLDKDLVRFFNREGAQ